MKREPLVEDIQDYALNIVDTVREPLLILDATLRVRSANRAFYQTFQVSAEETVDQLIYELGNGQWDIPDLRRLLTHARMERSQSKAGNRLSRDDRDETLIYRRAARAGPRRRRVPVPGR